MIFKLQFAVLKSVVSPDTYREAQVRAQVLQRMDRSFHVFVGQLILVTVGS